MYRRILLPLDGSALAERAEPYAAALARQFGAELILVRAVQLFAFPDVDQEARQVGAINQASEYLMRRAAALRRQGVEVSCVVHYTDPVRTITDEARLRDVDLIVMATHGRLGSIRWPLGSVANAVGRATATPLLLVPLSDLENGTPPGSLGPILVPLDGSPLAEHALTPALGLARRFGATVHLVQVIPLPLAAASWPAAQSQTWTAEQRTQAERYLQRLAQRFAEAEVPVQPVVQVGQPAEILVRYALANNIGLIVMSSHGQGVGWSRQIYGSVANDVLLATPASVLLLRSRPAAVEAPQPSDAAPRAAGSEQGPWLAPAAGAYEI